MSEKKDNAFADAWGELFKKIGEMTDATFSKIKEFLDKGSWGKNLSAFDKLIIVVCVYCIYKLMKG